MTVAVPPATKVIDPAKALSGQPDRHGQLIMLACWHFEQRALSALLQSDDEHQAFRLIHKTPYSPANHAFRDRVMFAWSKAYKSGGTLTDAVRSLDDEEAWQIRCAEYPLDTITETESACHRLIVDLRKEHCRRV